MRGSGRICHKILWSDLWILSDPYVKGQAGQAVRVRYGIRTSPSTEVPQEVARGQYNFAFTFMKATQDHKIVYSSLLISAGRNTDVRDTTSCISTRST